MSHTPGPWKFNERDNEIVGTSGESIAITTTLDYLTNYNNARLIAAAPEMLEALKKAYTLVCHDAESPRLYEAADIMAEVIAEAESNG